MSKRLKLSDGRRQAERFLAEQRAALVREALGSLIGATAQLGDGAQFSFPSPNELAALAVGYADSTLERMYARTPEPESAVAKG